LQYVDFGKSELIRAQINQWVSVKTNEKIQDLIPPGVFSGLTKMVLVNAIYFMGEWKEKFKPYNTKPGTFYAPKRKIVQVQMMNMTECLPYKQHKEFQILGMPYMGDDLSMFVILPKQQFGLAELVKRLNGKKLLEAISGTAKNWTTVTMPKFKLEETANLLPILAKLGASDMFDDQKADFSNINGKRIFDDNDGLVVSGIIHKAVIEVDEEGTVAAAATAMILRGGGYPPPKFTADHPFLFTIVDMRSMSVLFLGRYNGPN